MTANTNPTARFAEIAALPDSEVDLAEGALFIAAHAYPGLGVGRQRARLDDLAAASPGSSLDDLRTYLFDDIGFHGNVAHYDDPKNSFLNDVLDRRLGIPISLSVVVIEVGRRLGLDLRGVGMPGHFLVRVGRAPLFLDPYEGGTVLDEAGCRLRYRRLFGSRVPFVARHLEPVGPHAILARMLRNLKGAYMARRDLMNAEWVVRLRTMLPGVPSSERGDLAQILTALGRFDEGADVLEDLAMELPDDEARKTLTASRSVRARLN